MTPSLIDPVDIILENFKRWFVRNKFSSKEYAESTIIQKLEITCSKLTIETLKQGVIFEHI